MKYSKSETNSILKSEHLLLHCARGPLLAVLCPNAGGIVDSHFGYHLPTFVSVLLNNNNMNLWRQYCSFKKFSEKIKAVHLNIKKVDY